MKVLQNPKFINQNLQAQTNQKNKSIFDTFNPKKEKEYENGDAAMIGMYTDAMKVRVKAEEIATKIAKGENLSKDELDYIKEKKPNLLIKAKNANKQRELIEIKISKAKTKEDKIKIIQEAKSAAMNSIELRNNEYVEGINLQIEAIQRVEDEVKNSKEIKKSKENLDVLV